MQASGAKPAPRSASKTAAKRPSPPDARISASPRQTSAIFAPDVTLGVWDLSIAKLLCARDGAQERMLGRGPSDRAIRDRARYGQDRPARGARKARRWRY